MKPQSSFDPVWEQIYSEGRELNRYPFDAVVSFIIRHAPRDVPRAQIQILEVGCGAGNNLWFAAREGFGVAGIDASPSAIAYAQRHFAEDKLAADLRLGEFTSLPWKDDNFDFVVDRAAITFCGAAAASQAVGEVRRVLRPGGKFLFCTYSDRHSSAASGQRQSDGLNTDITSGSLVDHGVVRFYNARDFDELFRFGWRLLSLKHVLTEETSDSGKDVLGEWRAIAEKTA